MKRPAIILMAISALLLIQLGCGEKYKDLKACNDRVQALLKHNEALTKENNDLRNIMKATYEEQIRVTMDTHRKQVALLEEQVADLGMQWSVSERERLALQAILDQQTNLPKMERNNLLMERTVWICLVLCGFMMSATFAFRYHGLRKHRRDNIVRIVSELTRTGRHSNE